MTSVCQSYGLSSDQKETKKIFQFIISQQDWVRSVATLYLSFMRTHYIGCDVVSSMMGIGKKIAWNAPTNIADVIANFIDISQEPVTGQSDTIDSLHMRRLERLTVLMYSKNCAAQSVNEARKLMFTHGLKSLDSIPPTKNALFHAQNL